MSSRSLVFLGMTVGSVIGGYIPTFFGAGMFSYTSIITSALGSIIGIVIAYKVSNL